MMILVIVILILGALVFLAMLGFVALKIYSRVLINRGEWLKTNRSKWIDFLLENLT